MTYSRRHLSRHLQSTETLINVNTDGLQQGANQSLYLR